MSEVTRDEEKKINSGMQAEEEMTAQELRDGQEAEVEPDSAKTGGTKDAFLKEESNSPGAKGGETKEAGKGDSAPEGGDEDDNNDVSSEPGKEGAKKSFFSRKKDKKDEQIEELTDRLKRIMAEFDNFRKRTEKEKAAMYEIGARDIIEKILPVVDNFERGLATIPEGEEKSAFAEGMDKIYKQLMKTLEESGVKPIEALGQPFDPEFHNAVMHVEDDSLDENSVVEEFQKGYLYRDTVVRHSMVKVAN